MEKSDKPNKVGQEMVVILAGMQAGFMEKLKPGEANRIIASQLIILRQCQRFNIPVIILELRNDLYGSTVEVLMTEAKKNNRCFLINSRYNNGFAGTELDARLKYLKAKWLFFMGLFDYAFITITAEKGIDMGYNIATSNMVVAGPHYRTDNDDVIQLFQAEGICIETIDEFPKSISTAA